MKRRYRYVGPNRDSTFFFLVVVRVSNEFKFILLPRCEWALRVTRKILHFQLFMLSAKKSPPAHRVEPKLEDRPINIAS